MPDQTWQDLDGVGPNDALFVVRPVFLGDGPCEFQFVEVCDIEADGISLHRLSMSSAIVATTTLESIPPLNNAPSKWHVAD